MKLVSAVFASSLALAVVGCGGSQNSETTYRVTSPFAEDDGHYFDNGVSFIEAPASLGGNWEADWTELLEGRVQRADAIIIVTPHTFREDTTPSREVTYRIAGERTRELLGETSEEIQFVAREGEAGFASVRGHQERILEHSFVAYIKWRQIGEGASAEVVAAWHLEPASEAVVNRTVELVERLRGVSDHRTTVHYN